MKYLQELLESYSRLKKRNLKLLSEELILEANPSQQAMDMANDLIKKARQTGSVSVPVGGQLKVVDKASTSGKERGKVKSRVVYTGFPGEAAIDGFKNPRFFDFARLFDKTDQEQQPAEEAPPPSPQQPQQAPMQPDMMQQTPQQMNMAGAMGVPGAGIMSSDVGMFHLDKLEPAIESFTEIAGKAPELFKGLSKQDKVVLGLDEQQLLSNLVGAGPDSIESQVANCFTIRRHKGKFETVSKNTDYNLTNEVSRSILEVVKLASKTHLTDQEWGKLRTSIAMTSDNEIVVLDSTGKKGMVFNANSKVIRGILDSISSKISKEKKKDYKLKTIDVCREKKNSGKQVLKSKFYEEIPTSIAFIPMTGDKEMAKKYREAAFQSFSERIYEVLETFKPMTESDKMGLGYASTYDSDDPEFQMIRQIVKAGTNQLYSKLTSTFKRSFLARRPIRSIAAGGDTKFGSKQDAYEVYKDQDSVMKALAACGITDPKLIKKFKLIKQNSIDDLYKGEKNQQLRSIDTEFQKNQEVFNLPIGYKHYDSYEGGFVKMGDAFQKSLDTFLDGKAIKYKKGFDLDTKTRKAAIKIEKFRETIANTLGLVDSEGNSLLRPGTETQKEIAAFNRSMNDVDKKIDSLPDSAIIKGKGIKTEPFKQFCDSVIKSITSESDWKDLYGDDADEEKQTILGYLEKSYRKNAKESKEKAAALLKNYLRNRKLKKAIDSKNPKTRRSARAWLAVKTMYTGGSRDPALIQDAHDLGRGINKIFIHNEAFGMLRDWLKGDESVKCEYASGEFTISRGKSSLKTSDNAVLKRNGKGFSRKTSVEINEDYMSELDRRPKSDLNSTLPENSGELLLEFLNSQKEILTKLFSVITKGV